MMSGLIARTLTTSLALSAALFSNIAAASPPTEPSTFGRCTFPSSFVTRTLLRQVVLNDLTAKGFKTPSVTVTITSKNVRSPVKLTNITGYTSVTAKPDGSYQVNTSAPLNAACVTEATVTIRGSYTDTANARKNFTGTQTVQVNGAFN